MTFRDDLFGVLQPLFATTTIWANQGQVRPPLPYVVLNAKSRRLVNRDHSSKIDANGIMTVTGDREFTLSVQRLGNDSADALEAFADRLRTLTVIDALQRVGVAVVDIKPVMDISAALAGVDMEPRAGIDLILRVRSATLDDVGIIETVHVAGGEPDAPSGEDGDLYNVTVQLL